ncbi:MAG: DUF512 domain-containing protein [Lachnospiraceae bacterium]
MIRKDPLNLRITEEIMKKIEGHIITKIEPGSIAEELELEPGDRILSVNNQEIEDVFDYHYLIEDEYIELLAVKPNGEEWLLEIDKDYNEDLGIVFESSLMSEYKSCTNKCIFCFIDQMPPGMRETLYFKDDDSRLSFLQGNYITLTNMRDKDIDRIIKYHLSPINISVHTTNPDLRKKMLHNRFAGQALDKIKRLYDAGIEMNGQIVLCKGVNDGAELEKTIDDLAAFIPHMQSLSVVPVGLTKYREGLYPLESFEKEDAEKVIDLIEDRQRKIYEKHGIHFVQASDEFYILANRPMPEPDRYDGYIQLENGVGMVRLLLEESKEALEAVSKDVCTQSMEITLATGKLAYPFLREICGWVEEKFPNIKINVHWIRNDFFGEKITVSGLITGTDLINQLKDKKLGERLLLPVNMFRSGERVFLDDITAEEVETALRVPINIVKSSGQDLIETILGIVGPEEEPVHQPYEL